jgi:hypothetical protein
MGETLTAAEEKLIEELGLEDELVAFKDGTILKDGVMSGLYST